MNTGTIIKKTVNTLTKNWKAILKFYLVYTISFAFIFLFFKIILNDLTTNITIVMIISFVFSIIFFGGGYRYYLLQLSRGNVPSISELFSNWDLSMRLFSLALDKEAKNLLSLVPDTVNEYRYKYTSYILLDNPTLTNYEILKLNKKLAHGHKFSLYLIDSFLYISLAFCIFFAFFIPVLFIVCILLFMPFYEIAHCYCYNELLRLNENK